MATHISARLAWHDSGWNGCICDRPKLNVSCMAHEHIRDSRDSDFEHAHHGKRLSEIAEANPEKLPPCSRDPASFSEQGFTVIHHDPLDWRDLPEVPEDIPAFSFCTSPYGRMLTASGETWENDPVEQLKRLEDYWQQFEPGKSLVFFYVNHGNPLREQKKRILVGIGRISNISLQIFFGKKRGYENDNPIWSRCITHKFPGEGIRLPYQEYLSSGHDPSGIVCVIPDSARRAFSFVSEHVSDDVAVGIVERAVHCVAAVTAENKVPEPYGKSWQYRLDWLNKVLGEVWRGRGLSPGIGSVLEYLRFKGGTIFHRQFLATHKNTSIYDYVFSVLDGSMEPDTQSKDQFAKASEKWEAIPEERKHLLKLLAHFELSPDQVKRICNPDKRREAFIQATDQEIVDNPYIISELDDGAGDSPSVDFETIDRGMIPAHEIIGAKGAIQPIDSDDKRRVRALLVDVLKEALREGDTCLPLDEAFDRAAKRLPDNRRCEIDRDVFVHYRAFHGERLSFFPNGNQPQVLALGTVRKMEDEVRSRISEMVMVEYEKASHAFWTRIVDQDLKDVRVVDERTEQKARTEKGRALGTLFTKRFSVLTGKAGTGKTTVLRALIKGLEEKEGKQPVLLLAPTGKARVRLQETTGRTSKTIHQFLMQLGWIRGETFSLLPSGGKTEGASTVIIDEASMIPLDLLATLFRAVDFNDVKRLILVGDPNQLPPIGPGRAFVDIVKWLESSQDTENHIARLEQRVRHEELESQALKLADSFLGEKASPGDDEILTLVAKKEVSGDLEVHFWEDPDQLRRILDESFRNNLGFDLTKESDYKGFNESTRTADCWQILSPTRMEFFGTSEINRVIQGKFKRGLIEQAKNKKWKPKPFGEQQIVWSDKVIQIVNSTRSAFKESTKLSGYVANGEVGLVTRTTKKYDSLHVTFSTQPESEYPYYRKEVDENLELAYAVTVHKAQGSDFGKVFLILPQKTRTMSKELLYTGFTRFKQKMVLLIEKDINPLLIFRKPQNSEILRRNTNLFQLALRPDTEGFPCPERLVHKTLTGVLVRSKSEVVIGNILTKLGISYKYEEPLYSRTDPRDFRLPDFTVKYQGKTFYWEHLGMLGIPQYEEDWQKKEKWYKENGYYDQLIVSADGPGESIDSKEIAHLAKERIISGGP